MLKRLTATAALCALFLAAFAAGKKPSSTSPAPVWADSLRSTYLYTEGIKLNAISGDSIRARQLFLEAIRADSTYAPAYFELATNGMYSTPDQAVELARTAFRLDTANKWYHQFYGQALIYAQRYPEALKVYRQLMAENPKDPDNYRLVAALYEQGQQPFSAIATLDSAELRFGRIPVLSAMKRQLLISTRQFDKALAEARAMVDAAPYEAEHHVALAELYGATGKDSLARAEYDRAMQIDSADVPTLMSLSDYHSSKRDYRSQLDVTKRLFVSDAVPLDVKIRRFEQFTTDMRFYREFYFQLNDLASTLAIRYPSDQRVIKLYADHLIASGELERALELYKIHTHDTPPVEEYFRAVIDIESYLKHTDSVNVYVNRALELFPDKPEFHISKGHVMSYRQQHVAAIKAYKESLRFADTDSLRSTIWGYIGDAWHQKALRNETTDDERDDLETGFLSKKSFVRKNMKQCYKAYDRSLRYNPSNASVLNNYAYFLSLERRDLEKALSMSSRAIALSENNPTFLDTHAWVLFRMGRTAEAKKVMQQAIALDARGSRELLVHYGDILHALGEQFMAETYWKKALEKGYDAAAIEQRLAQPRKSVPAKE